MSNYKEYIYLENVNDHDQAHNRAFDYFCQDESQQVIHNTNIIRESVREAPTRCNVEVPAGAPDNSMDHALMNGSVGSQSCQIKHGIFKNQKYKKPELKQAQRHPEIPIFRYRFILFSYQVVIFC